jgi:hypothetical protein
MMGRSVLVLGSALLLSLLITSCTIDHPGPTPTPTPTTTPTPTATPERPTIGLSSPPVYIGITAVCLIIGIVTLALVVGLTAVLIRNKDKERTPRLRIDLVIALITLVVEIFACSAGWVSIPFLQGLLFNPQSDTNNAPSPVASQTPLSTNRPTVTENRTFAPTQVPENTQTLYTVVFINEENIWLRLGEDIGEIAPQDMKTIALEPGLGDVRIIL